MASPPHPSFSPRELPGLPVLHPELGAVILVADRPLSRRVGVGTGVLGVLLLPFAPFAGLALLVASWALPRLVVGPMAIYERGVATRRHWIPWGDLESIRLKPAKKAWELEVLGRHRALVFPVADGACLALADWLAGEALEPASRRIVGQVLQGLRWTPGEGSQVCVHRGGVVGPEGEVDWGEITGLRVGPEVLEVLGGAGSPGPVLRVERSAPGALLLRAVLEYWPVFAYQCRVRAGDGELGTRTSSELRQLANGGIPDAACLLGKRFLAGVGVDRDAARAKDWFRRAARAGHPEGNLLLATWFRDRARVDWDVERVVGLLEVAAAAGLPEAQAALGFHLEVGEGVLRSALRAGDWYDRAIEGGFAPDRRRARVRAFQEYFAGMAASSGADRPLPGLPREDPSFGALVFSQPHEELGEPLGVYEGGVVSADTRLKFSPYVVLRTWVEPSPEGPRSRVRLEDGEVCLELNGAGPRARLLRWAFERLVADRLSEHVLVATRAGTTLHFAEDYRITLDANGISEEIARRRDVDVERVAWGDLEGVEVMRGQVHFLARRGAGEPRAVVSLGLEEPSAWVLRSVGERVTAAASSAEDT